jgi:hypothetical protein
MTRGFDSVPRELVARLTRDLQGERILWAGQPSPRAAFWAGAPIWLFAIPWLAFSLGWEAIALAAYFGTDLDKTPGGAGLMAAIFPLFGIPFVLIGIGLVGKPFWNAWRARRSVHVLTDKRLVTARLRGSALEVDSIAPGRIMAISRLEGREGIGTLTFSLGAFRDSDGDPVEKRESWVGIADVKTLEDRLRQIMAGGGA